jgi:uncharacterized protein (DUF1778 family)
MATPLKTKKRDTLNMRIKPADRNLIDHAAQLMGKSRTDFLLDAGRRAAQDALLDQTVFKISPAQYEKFIARLDAPPTPNPKLRRLMKAKRPWEE